MKPHQLPVANHSHALHSGPFDEVSSLISLSSSHTPPHLDPDRRGNSIIQNSSDPSRLSLQQLFQQRRPTQQINSLEIWLRAWSRFLRAMVHYFPQKAVQMIAYQDCIIAAAERYHFEGLYSYDRAFRMAIAHNPSIRWDSFDEQLWSVWCSSQAKPLCNRCHRFGHSQAACPAASRDSRSFRNGQQTPSQPKTKDGRTICLRFNTSTCPNPSRCKFAHVCLKCDGDHPQSSTACGRT